MGVSTFYTKWVKKLQLQIVYCIQTGTASILPSQWRDTTDVFVKSSLEMMTEGKIHRVSKIVAETHLIYVVVREET